MTIDMLEWRDSTVATVNTVGNAVTDFVLDHPDAVTVTALFGAGIIIHRWWVNRKIIPSGEHDEMKRRVQLESTYADKIHDFMLDMLVKGEINRKEYKRDCRRFGIAFRLYDLLRPVRSKIGIKHKILRNVSTNHATLPFIQTKEIPGPKPGEVPALPSKPKARRLWVVVGKRRKTA